MYLDNHREILPLLLNRGRTDFRGLILEDGSPIPSFDPPMPEVIVPVREEPALEERSASARSKTLPLNIAL